MGNWTTVQMDGTCDAKEVPGLKAACDPGTDYANFHCLSNGSGIFGIGGWPAEVIRSNGNLAERGYSHDDIVEQLVKLVEVAPSLKLKMHVGGDYESKDCAATITVEDGKVVLGEPEIEKLADFSEQDIKNRTLGALHNAHERRD